MDIFVGTINFKNYRFVKSIIFFRTRPSTKNLTVSGIGLEVTFQTTNHLQAYDIVFGIY